MEGRRTRTNARSDPAPTSYPELRALLQRRLPDMPPGQQRIARLILSDPEGCAFRTIGETARATEVHESSVVRFATSLQLDGYPGLIELCRQHLSDQARLLRRFDEAQQHGTSTDLLTTIASFDERNLARTYARIDRVAWDSAVDLLAEAPAIHVIGLRKCFSIAYLLAYLLHLVRRDVHQLQSGAGLLADQLRDVSDGDVLVAVSIHRYTADTLRSVAYAKGRGIRTIVLTDNPASPLVRYSDIVFYVDTSGVTILRSLTAFSSLVQALATAVAVKLGTRSRSELLLDEEVHTLFHAFADEPDGTALADMSGSGDPSPKGATEPAGRVREPKKKRRRG
jgi:DNA-binding MurR/RpiR family transcriptional regulator